MLTCLAACLVTFIGPYPGWDMVSWETIIEGGSTSGSPGSTPQITVAEKQLFNETVWGSDLDTYSRMNPGTGLYEESLKENTSLTVTVRTIESGALRSPLANWKHENQKFWYVASIQSNDLPDGVPFLDYLDKYRVNDNVSQWPDIYDSYYDFQIPVRVTQPVPIPPPGGGTGH